MPTPDDSRRIETLLAESGRLRGLAAALLRGAAADEVDDVVQEASVAALTHAPPVPDGELGEGGGSPLVAWLRRIVRHRSIDVLRRRARREARERIAARPEALPGADESVHRLQLHRAVVAAVESLPRSQREVVLRRFFDGVKPARIAKESGEPVATVKTRLRRALAELRRRLRGEWGDSWMGALLVLAKARPIGPIGPFGPAGTAGSVSVATGVLAMTSKSKLVVALAAALIVGVAGFETWRVSHRSHAEQQEALEAGRAPADSGSSVVAAIEATRAPELGTPPDESSRPPNAPLVRSRRDRLDPRRLGDLHGRVVDEKGVGVAGVEVEIVRRIGAELPFLSPPPTLVVPAECHRSRSDRDGSFAFSDLVLGGEFRVGASTSDGRVGELRNVRAGRSDSCDVVLGPTHAVTGVVVDIAGRPEIGARVVVRHRESSEGASRMVATTDGAGRFELHAVPRERVAMQAFATDGRFSVIESVQLDRSPPAEVRFVVGGGGAVDGLVLDAESDAPIAGAIVQLSNFHIPDPDVLVARSTMDGIFHVEPGEAWSTLSATVIAPGYVGGIISIPPPASPATRIVVKLHRGRIATGRVVAKSGVPIAGAIVALLPFSEIPEWRATGAASATADDGSFRLEGFEPRGHHFLVVRHDECEQVIRPIPDAAPLTNGAIDLGAIVVGVGSLVSGVVVDENGEPALVAGVSLSHRDAASWDDEGSVQDPRSDADRGAAAIRGITEYVGRRYVECDPLGRFECHGVAAGRWFVRAAVAGGTRPTDLAIEVGEDEVRDEVRIVVPTRLVLAGRVVDGNGNGVTGAYVTIGRFTELGTEKGAPLAHRYTDAVGGFRLSGLDEGSFWLSVHPPSRPTDEGTCLLAASMEKVAAGTTDLMLRLPEGARITGRVQDQRGMPIRNASLVAASSADSAVASGTSDRDGEFELIVPCAIELSVQVRPPRLDGEPDYAAAMPSRVAARHLFGGDPPIIVTIGEPADQR